jgi:2-polyprenyl-6-methoxyphenol hydroxylase-like FAD-dependent oxidoreductase
MRDWLMQNIDVKFNKRLLRVEEHGSQVTAHFEDGTSATGDFLVGAEGTRSAVRTHLLQGQDVMKPLPIGSIFAEIALSGDEFAQQLTLSHSNYIVMDPRLSGDQQTVIFCALNRVSPDGKTGYYYYILLWVNKSEKRWTESASQEQLAAFAREKTRGYPDRLRTLVDKIPTEGYHAPGFQLQGVDLEPEQLPAGRVLLIGDAAHSMAPCKSHGPGVPFPSCTTGCIEQHTDDKGQSPRAGRKHGLCRRVQAQLSPQTRAGHAGIRRSAEGSRGGVQRRHGCTRQVGVDGVQLGSRGL